MWGIPGLCPICLAEEFQPQQGPRSLGEGLVGIIRGQDIGDGLSVGCPESLRDLPKAS